LVGCEKKKKKLCGRTLKAYELQDKPNLDNIFKMDWEGLCNSLDYFERL
jgi:hypothetical protein